MLEDREFEFRLNSERLVGRFDALPMVSQEDATIDLMLSEAIKTSEVEGEDLDRESQVITTVFDSIGYATGEHRPESSGGCFAAGGRPQKLANIPDA